VLRRATAPSRLVRLNGRFTIDPATHCVSIDGQALVLSPREFGVMWVLAVNNGHHLATDDLSQRVLSGTADRARSEIHVLISTLRAKLRLAGNIVWIETIARKGYALRCRDHRHPNP
jgi:DNA-binding response OmpR family regulator